MIATRTPPSSKSAAAIVAQPAGTPGEFVDRFDGDRRRGDVVGSTSPRGVSRGGVDLERVIAIDHDAVRIAPLLQAGWGRSILSYGPYQRQPGLLFAAMVLNGHNTSQWEPLPESLPKRLVSWLEGHDGRGRALFKRAWQWLRYPRKRLMLWRLRWWRRMARAALDPLNENLAIGWFDAHGDNSPQAFCNAFTMHAALGDNGELWARTCGHDAAVVRGVQNVPVCYLVVLREQGAAYYLSSLAGAHAGAAYPLFRPVAIDAVDTTATLVAGIHQAALGQIGFRVDTRVYGTQARAVPSLAAWYGAAHAADTLAGEGPLQACDAEAGGPWVQVEGNFERGADGCVATGAANVALLRPGRQTGLLHTFVALPVDVGGEAGLVVRHDDDDNNLRVLLNPTGVTVVQTLGGLATAVAQVETVVERGRWLALQVQDDGVRLQVAIDGQPLFPAGVEHRGAVRASAVGICSANTHGARFRMFEAHPAEVDFSGELELELPVIPVPAGPAAVVDHFSGPAGQDLAGRTAGDGTPTWRRTYGRGRLLTTGDGAIRVDATVERPNPGNTAYTIDWDEPGYADIAADITPPGTGRGQAERGRAGLVFWQNPRNYLMVSMYVDDMYDGASIAIFSHLDGFEEIYDAVWSMVADKIHWGRTHRLRVTFDGLRLVTYIDDEPVLYRALTDIYADRGPLAINRVGLAVNWEWGDDTGSRFANFSAAGTGGLR
jgi:hypothetical protein